MPIKDIKKGKKSHKQDFIVKIPQRDLPNHACLSKSVNNNFKKY